MQNSRLSTPNDYSLNAGRTLPLSTKILTENPSPGEEGLVFLSVWLVVSVRTWRGLSSCSYRRVLIKRSGLPGDTPSAFDTNPLLNWAPVLISIYDYQCEVRVNNGSCDGLVGSEEAEYSLPSPPRLVNVRDARLEYLSEHCFSESRRLILFFLGSSVPVYCTANEQSLLLVTTDHFFSTEIPSNYHEVLAFTPSGIYQMLLPPNVAPAPIFSRHRLFWQSSEPVRQSLLEHKGFADMYASTWPCE